MNHSNYKLLAKRVSFLILDFQKPVELDLLLRSLKRNVLFNDCEIVVLSNGGEQDYVLKYYQEGLIDRLILNNVNEGCGFGTMRLVQQCSTKYFFYLQNDCFLHVPLDSKTVDDMIAAIENSNIGAFELKGVFRGERFSESCFFMNTDFYLANPDLEGGGPGVYQHLSNVGKLIPTEHATSEWITKNNKRIATTSPVLFWNTGKYTIRETACGGVILFRCDSQQLWIVKPPLVKYEDMKYTNEEWDLILTGKWVGGTIPEHNKNSVFSLFGPPDEIGKPPEQYARFFHNKHGIK